ncbi:MAG: UDP-N-acetylmuramoyl-L-alanyl-D-glutamate--2,6-diaminopimelate ligase [Kiritimatiellia bacterium]|jgi:UDP-N-acetylmuramoyl-L-alanyl-D-glutamate--2,6-diaminopimelate ligase
MVHNPTISSMTLAQLLVGRNLSGSFGVNVDESMSESMNESIKKTLAEVVVSGLSIDSRQINRGDIFVAVQGIGVHGRDYISQAIERGAAAIFIDSNDEQLMLSCQQDIPVIAIPLLEKNLSCIAGQYYNHPSIELPVVGITGTNGKTTCAQLYAQLSALTGKVSGVIGTIGYGCCSLASDNPHATVLPLISTGMTTPDAIRTQAICAELLAAGSHNIVMEVSSHGLEQGRVADIDFTTAVFTNLTHDHLDYHGSMQKYAAAKTQLFTLPSLQHAVINLDDAYAEQLMSQINSCVSIVTYSVFNSAADFFLSDVRYKASSTSALLHTPSGVYPLLTHLLGAFNLSNLLAVLSTFYIADNNASANDDFENILSLSQHLTTASGRMELIENSSGRQVIVDYAHTPDALENVLQSLSENTLVVTEKKLWCVFGCGGDRDKEKRALMAKIAERYADHVVVTSDNPRGENPRAIIDDICQGFIAEKHQVISDREQAIATTIERSAVNDIIIIAGKGHEDYQLIGDKKMPFSDQNIARLALRTLEAKYND